MHIGDAFFDLDAAAFLLSQMPDATSATDCSPPHTSAKHPTAPDSPEFCKPVLSSSDKAAPADSAAHHSLTQTSYLPSSAAQSRKSSEESAHVDQAAPEDRPARDSCAQATGQQSSIASTTVQSKEACEERLPQRSRPERQQRRNQSAGPQDQQHAPSCASPQEQPSRSQGNDHASQDNASSYVKAQQVDRSSCSAPHCLSSVLWWMW